MTLAATMYGESWTSTTVQTMAPEISVVVPVFSGTEELPQLHSRLNATLTKMGRTFELILVDDRGNPQSWGTIRSLADNHANVIGIRLGRNFGQHAATLCGIRHAKGKWVVTMDEDLEHPPECLPAMIEQCSDATPLVYGVFPTRTHAAHRNITSEIMRRILKRAFPELNEQYSSFRVMRGALARDLAAFHMHRPYLDGVLSWLTSGVASVEVEHGRRLAGQSAYTWRRLISHAVNIFITFSNLPLRMASIAGGILACLSVVYLMYIVWQYLIGAIPNPGYASLMSVVLLACGVQLVILGVIGEYIGRLMGAANRKPMFSIESTCGPSHRARSE
ncbi:MAG: glycosyltransferase family 2 protein [Pseudomarimonas sp.]